MNKNWIIICLLLILIVNFVGCAGKREVDELGIVNVTAVDWDHDLKKYRIIVQVISPTRGAGGMGAENRIWNASATGRTLMRASKNLRAVVSKNLVWFHSNLIIIGKEVAKRGIDQIIDFFARNQEIRYNSWILVSEYPIQDIMELNPRFEGSLSQEIQGIIQNNERDWSETTAVNLKDLLIRLADKDFDEVVGRITDYTPQLPPEGTYKQLDLMKGIPKDQKQVIALSGSAILKDGKLKGWFTRPETRGYLWLTNKIEGGTVVDVGGGPHKVAKYSVELLQASSKLEPEIKNGKINFKLEIKTGVGITEAIDDLDLTKSENITKIQKSIAAEIKTEIKATLEKAQQVYNTDIFGYGNSFYRSYPKEWEKIKDDWDQIFPNVTTDIKVEVIIKRLGMISKPISK